MSRTNRLFTFRCPEPECDEYEQMSTVADPYTGEVWPIEDDVPVCPVHEKEMVRK